jgi:hypothetical protein
MAWILIIILAAVVGMMLMSTISSSQDGRRKAAMEAAAARDFSGVVVSQTLMAHAFDAGYSCRIVIQCDDGSTVTWDASAHFLDRLPVGTRVTHTAGQKQPVEDKSGAVRGSDAPVEGSSVKDSVKDSVEDSVEHPVEDSAEDGDAAKGATGDAER